MHRVRTALALIAAMLVTAPTAHGQVQIGDFYFFDRSEGDRVQMSVTTLAEENPIRGAGGLTWVCENGEAKLIVSSTYLGRSMRARVRWAFDGEEPGDTQSWILRRSGMAVIAPTEIAAEFTERARSARRVLVQLTDYQFRRHGYTFTLYGIADALAMLPCVPQAGS